MKMITPHFAEHELCCKHCGKLPPAGMSIALMEGLEKLRALLDRPVYVSSGYRCPAHNFNVGGVSDSQHV